MKYFLLICCIVFTGIQASGQAEEAIIKGADTMARYLPKSGLAEKVIVKRIIITGNKITRRSIILREMSVHENDTLALDSIPKLLNQNKLRLFNMTLFNDITMDIEKINKNEISWRIHVKERWYILPSPSFGLTDRNFNVWWTEQDHDLRRANAGITLTDKNFRGNLEVLALTVQAGYTRQIALNYLKPYIDKKQKSGLGFTLSYSESRETYYNTDSNKLLYIHTNEGNVLKQFEGGITYTYRPAYAIRHILQLTYKDYRIGDTIRRLNSDYYANDSRNAKLLELLYRFELNQVDNWNYPLIGFKTVIYGVARTGIEGFNFQAFANVEAGTFHNPLPKWYTSIIFRGRLMSPESQPYAFIGGLGGKTDYVRGYEYYVIDGSQYGLLRLDLKREVLNTAIRNVHIRYLPSIPIRIYPKIFADAGYIKNADPGTSFLANRWLYSAGFGVDIVTAYDIKIRLEYTWNHLGQKDIFLHTNSE